MRDWKKYKKRHCYTLHECALCGEDILLGEFYYDGGYGRRAHEQCVEKNQPREVRDERIS